MSSQMPVGMGVSLTQADVPALAAVVADNTALSSAIAALQAGPSQLLINPVPNMPGAAIIYTPSAQTVADILADLQATQTSTAQQLATTYGILS